LGYLFNFLPLYFGKWWSENKVGEIEFVAPIKASLALGAYLIYLSILLAIGLVINQKWIWILLISIPILGLNTLLFYDFKQLYLKHQSWARLNSPNQVKLTTLRKSILIKLKEMGKGPGKK